MLQITGFKCLQVLHAKRLRAADIGGSSDTFCKIKFGPFKAQTRTLKKCLDPEWNETFMFMLEPDALALMGGVPMISFEVWDHNKLAPNYFLGEVMPVSCHAPFLTFLILLLAAHAGLQGKAGSPMSAHTHASCNSLLACVKQRCAVLSLEQQALASPEGTHCALIAPLCAGEVPCTTRGAAYESHPAAGVAFKLPQSQSPQHGDTRLCCLAGAACWAPLGANG